MGLERRGVLALGVRAEDLGSLSSALTHGFPTSAFVSGLSRLRLFLSLLTDFWWTGA